MGRPPKEKFNYEEQFKRLYEKPDIKGNAKLLRKMYTKYYKDFPGVDPDVQVWVNSQLPDFGKKIKGERPFTESDIKAIERALDMSWVDIVEPLPEKPEKKKEKKFEEKGIRFAAHIDEEWCYQDLADSYDVDEYNVALCNYDEYGKTIIDYIIENKAKKGLEFLINKGYLWCNNGSLEFNGKIYRAEEHSKELWDWIVSLDDSELFLKALGEQNLFDCSFCRMETGEDFLDKIIENENIFNALCRERVYRKNNLKYMPGLLFEALKFSLNKNKDSITQKILLKYKDFIDEQTKVFQKEIVQESNNGFKVCNNYNTQREIEYGDNSIMFVWDFSALPKKYENFEEQIVPCQISNVLNQLRVKSISKMEYGDSFVKDGIYYIKKKFDLSLEALRYLTEEKGCKFLPTYIGEECGVTKIHAYKSDWHGVEFSELGEMLGEIHLLSQEKLGADRVYMYSRGFTNGFGHMFSGGARVIINWQTCEIGTPILDIVTAFLNYRYAYAYFGQVHNRFIEGKTKSYEELSQFLDAYPDKKVIENFGDKFNEELDRMLKNEIQGTQGKNTEAIEKLYMAKSFAEIYRNELNLITNQNCESKGDNK